MKTLAVGEFKTHFSEALELGAPRKDSGVLLSAERDTWLLVLAPPKLVLEKGRRDLGIA